VIGMNNQIKRVFSVTLLLAAVFLLFAQIALAVPEYEENVKPSYVVLLDSKSGKVLYSKNADESIVPASTTKVMTCILGLEYGDLSSEVVVSRAASRVSGSAFKIKEGEKIVFSDLLMGLMLCSGNDAAAAVAEHIGGSTEVFVEMMNAKAREIGMTNTYYINPHGLPVKDGNEEFNNRTTAADMAKLALYAMKNKTFMDIVGHSSFAVPKTNKNKARTIKNTNRLIKSDFKEYYQYATGMKTGFTNEAGNCLIATAKKDGMELACLVYRDDSKDGRDRWSLAKNLFEFGFDNFVTVELESLLGKVKPVTALIENYALNDKDGGLLEFEKPAAEYVTISKSVYNSLNGGSDSIEAVCEYIVEEPIQAPVNKDDLLGAVKYVSVNTGDVIYEGSLIATRDVYEAGADIGTEDQPVVTMTPKPPDVIIPPREKGLVWMWALIPVGLIAFIVVRLLTMKKSGRRRMTKRRKPQYSYRIRR